MTLTSPHLDSHAPAPDVAADHGGHGGHGGHARSSGGGPGGTVLRGEVALGDREPQRRRIGAARPEDTAVVVGAGLSGLGLAWLICFQLLPWGNPAALLVLWLATSLAVLAVLSAVQGTSSDVVDRVAGALVHAGALVVLGALATVLVYTFYRGWRPLVHPNTYLRDMAGVGPRAPLDQGGIAHAIVGSFIELGIAIAVTLPLGIGTAVYMTEVGGRFARVVRTIVEAMTALPSIVAGLFVYTVGIIGLGAGRSGIAASAAIAVMMLPIIARAADVVLRVVPGGLREASLALGASRWRTVWHVVLPTARPGLATALILGVARGVGETSPVLLTSGYTTYFNADPFHGVMTSLPLYIFSTVRSGEPRLIERGYGAAAVLMMIVLVLFVVARLLARPPRAKARPGRPRPAMLLTPLTVTRRRFWPRTPVADTPDAVTPNDMPVPFFHDKEHP